MTDVVSRVAKDWRAHPDRWSVDVLGFRPWKRQREVMRSFARAVSNARGITRGPTRVAVRSGHKVGKSSLGAILALWCYVNIPGVRVIMTAPSGHQVEDILYRELRTRYLRAKMKLGGRLYETSYNGLVAPDGSEVVGIATKSGEQFSGISAPFVVYIVDEASGIEEAIFEAIAGNTAGGAVVLLLGNPTMQSGEFYAAFHDRRTAYYTHHISSEETPNVILGEMKYPGLATRVWLEERREEWGGPGNAAYDVRVKGDFARSGERVVIPLHLVEAAKERYARTLPTGRLCIGVDVARYGDDLSVIRPRRGYRALPAQVAPRDTSTTMLAHLIAKTAKELRYPGEVEPAIVNIDVIGVGAGTHDRLRELQEEPEWKGVFEARAVNVANACTTVGNSDTKYKNVRAQMWFSLADWIKAGGAIDDDRHLEGELVAQMYGYDARMRYELEKKDEVKKRLKRSPDRAEALALAVFEAPHWVPQGARVADV